MKYLLRVAVLLIVLSGSLWLVPASTQAFDLPSGFENVQVIGNLQDPSGFDFSPDGRMFIAERVTGRLLVARYDDTRDQWVLNPQPFYTFDTPKDSNGNPEARRSAGLRDIAFDPNFASNGYVYAFYMKHGVFQNRVVRLKANTGNPDVADTGFGEQLLLEVPFNDSQANGSHNGGGIEFGADGKLYITTGDGWTGDPPGDPVQSLETFTGKVLRINPDGSIPADNPFHTQTTGTYRAIYALGLRNPYSLSRHPETGDLYINEARGTNKADIYIVEAGANYGHEGSGPGTPRAPWANASGAGGELVTGGAWYPSAGPFPAQYHGVYFVALWGSNTDSTGQISYIQSPGDTSVVAFEREVGVLGTNGLPVKPVITRIGPDGNLYYMLTTYTTSSGTIQMVRFTSQQTVATPTITPSGGTFADPVEITLSTSTPDAQLRYTLDGSEPDSTSTLYTGPFTVSTDTIVKAKAFKNGLNPSSTQSALFIIGDQPDNLPPSVDAGEDQTVTVSTTVTLDGSGTTDPDGDDNFLTGEQWTQVSGPPVTIIDATEEVAYFTPTQAGVYVFELTVSDGRDTGSDQVTITVIETRSCRASGLQALYTFQEGEGTVVNDVAGTGTPLNLTIESGTSAWLPDGGLVMSAPTRIASSEAATGIIAASQSTNELSIEAWITPANTTQNGPARIVTLSGGTQERNFTLEQGLWGDQPTDVFDVRLRTTDASINDNGEPLLATPPGTATTALTHVVFTRSADGAATIYIDGVAAATGTIPGDFANWETTYRLALANEFGDERPWVGELHRVAVYSCDLSVPEVQANYAAGPDAPVPTGSLPLYLPIVQK